ncbi:MAG: transglutaminase domain-containing protein [Melioribacteraceae bacterium]|nr:transglutaminase domain-containing protein [Melioribacteraceae bacterium]
MFFPQTKYDDINTAIENGNYKIAEGLISKVLQNESLDAAERLDLQFQIERMNRIRKDFKKTSADILAYVRNYYPEADEKFLEERENDGTLEFKIIDGEKFYFNRSHTNLFRVNKNAKMQKEKASGFVKNSLDRYLEKYLPEVVKTAKIKGNHLVMPVSMKLNYRLVVNADAVPAGENIRAWLPYPREGHNRQQLIKLIRTNADEYIIADNSNLQRTIYMEKVAERGKPTEFELEVSYTGFNEWHSLNTANLNPYDKSSDLYIKYTSELEPHIVFSDKIKELSEMIVGGETNPLLAAKMIYKWINDNIPWAGAREYSTINNISDYCLSNGWGDCGIQTLTFMTLCRFNGIPAKWQSGWMLHPGEVNLHDWCEIYFEGYGWVPVDQSFKLVDSDDEDVKWFYFGGTDAYHLIINDDYSQPLFPAKIFPRSETVDFQRGEVEWRGGNLYFDQWDYFMKVEYENN